MAQLGRPGLTAEQERELWARWKAGESLSDIGRALGKQPGSIHGGGGQRRYLPGGADPLGATGPSDRRRTWSTATSPATSSTPLWVADLTCVPTREGFLYLSVVLDACSRRVIGWTMRDDLKTEDALDLAIRLHRPLNVVHHSDQGCQYTSLAFRHRCRQAGIRPSMGSVGDAYDNALCERFSCLPRGPAFLLATGLGRESHEAPLCAREGRLCRRSSPLARHRTLTATIRCTIRPTVRQEIRSSSATTLPAAWVASHAT